VAGPTHAKESHRTLEKELDRRGRDVLGLCSANLRGGSDVPSVVLGICCKVFLNEFNVIVGSDILD
jgi:hypothetical protein